MNRSFQALWFSTRTWLHYNETFKISSASRAKIVTKCIKIVSTDVRKYKFFSGEIPRTPLTRGGLTTLVLSPYSRKTYLMFHGRTTFQKPTTALTVVASLVEYRLRNKEGKKQYIAILYSHIVVSLLFCHGGNEIWGFHLSFVIFVTTLFEYGWSFSCFC